MKNTKSLSGIELVYACAKQSGATDEEFKAMSDDVRLCFVIGLITSSAIATWKSGNAWRASCPSQYGYYDNENGLIDMGLSDGVTGATIFEAAMRAYLIYRAGHTVTVPDWVNSLGKP